MSNKKNGKRNNGNGNKKETQLFGDNGRNGHNSEQVMMAVAIATTKLKPEDNNKRTIKDGVEITTESLEERIINAMAICEIEEDFEIVIEDDTESKLRAVIKNFPKEKSTDFFNALAKNMIFMDGEAGVNADNNLINLVIRPNAMTENVE